jgi:serine/threonine-protein phosphatase PP1 catalytic subunit
MNDAELNPGSKLYQFNNNVRKILVVGDLHGDYLAYQSFIKAWKKENGAFIIFLGDYADRGKQGLEIIDSMMKMVDNPRVVALKGNHEVYSIPGIPQFSPCNLISEVEEKRGSWPAYYRNNLRPLFQKFYMAALLPGKILFVHGGISNRITSIDSLAMPNSQIEEDILWNDPIEANGEYPSRRGRGREFGPDVTRKVLHYLNVHQVIRSHQPYLAAESPFYSHGDQIITISSTSIFGGKPFYMGIDILNNEYQIAVKTL